MCILKLICKNINSQILKILLTPNTGYYKEIHLCSHPSESAENQRDDQKRKKKGQGKRQVPSEEPQLEGQYKSTEMIRTRNYKLI